MSLQRQHFLLSYLKTLSVGPAGVELTTSRVTARCLTNSWFSSYLSDRTQRARYGDAVSQMLTLTHGVPQGSILGPVLFTTYIDGLINLVTHSQVSCYVDDSQLFLKLQ